MISGLNASVSSAVSTSGYAYTANGIAYRCGVVTFTTTAGIAAASGVFNVNFQHPFRTNTTPVVLCGGGTNNPSAWAAFFAQPTLFQAVNVTAIGIVANQVMQWIAIGV